MKSRIIFSITLALILSAVLMAIVPRQAPQPLRVAGNMTTIEISPVQLAGNGLYPGPIVPSMRAFGGSAC
jgi:hypothetical protein